jgi:hypothetical protein
VSDAINEIKMLRRLGQKKASTRHPAGRGQVADGA